MEGSPARGMSQIIFLEPIYSMVLGSILRSTPQSNRVNGTETGDLSNWGLLPTKNLFIQRTRIERILSKNPVFFHFHFDSIHRFDWPTGGPVRPKGASGVEKEKELRASGVDLFIFLFVNIFFWKRVEHEQKRRLSQALKQ